MTINSTSIIDTLADIDFSINALLANTTTMTRKIAYLATLENAKAYAKEVDQWVFVKNLIECADIHPTDSLIDELEDALDALVFPI
jgi:hypothetical protein